MTYIIKDAYLIIAVCEVSAPQEIFKVVKVAAELEAPGPPEIQKKKLSSLVLGWSVVPKKVPATAKYIVEMQKVCVELSLN